MMPSRGSHLARLAGPKLHRSQSRNLSSTALAGLQRPSRRFPSIASQCLTRQSAQTFVPLAASSQLCGLRFASTNTTPAVPASSPSSNLTTESSFPNLDTITLDNVNNAIGAAATSPNEIGYLHSLGLDYGYGPTSLIEWVLEHVHVYSGMPWWGSILVTATALRLALAPLFVAASDSMARSAAVGPLTRPWNDRMQEARKRNDTTEMMLCLREVQQIQKDAGYSLRKAFTPSIVQGVLGYCGFKLIGAMAKLPVPEFTNGGFLWLTDLTASDGFLILPTFMALLIHTVFRLGGETGAAQLPPGAMKIFLYVLPAISFGFIAYQPAALALWFTATGVVGIAQGQVLQRPWVRERLGIAPLYKPKPGQEPPSLMDVFGSKKQSDSRSSTASARARTIDTKLVNNRKRAPSDMVQPRQNDSMANLKQMFRNASKTADSEKPVTKRRSTKQ